MDQGPGNRTGREARISGLFLPLHDDKDLDNMAPPADEKMLTVFLCL
jgi:hypothetical protein